jgi:hypothetical protein
MRLFHLSHSRYSRLEPQVGSKRHDGEDPRAVGVPVVWLANDPKMRSQGPSGEVPAYQHEVDVPDDDPALQVDEPFDQMMKQGDKMFGTSTVLRWYFLTRGVDVLAVKTWDASSRDYL